MPPKGRGGGARGRGRGRGKAPATSAPDLEGTLNDNPGSQSTDTTAENEPSEPSNPIPRVTTPQNLNNPPSPNSSPATVPTETPAPTPARILPPPKTYTSGPSTSASGRGGRGGAQGPEKPSGPSRFKPNAIRRDNASREKLAEQETARRLAAQANYEKEQAILLRGRGRGRGRGDVMGRGRGRPGTASGIFGVAPEGLKQAGHLTIKRDSGGPSGTARSGVRYSSSGHSGGSGGGGGGGGGGGSSSGGNTSKGYVEDPEYPDEDSNTPRVNIENIDKQEDEDVIFTGSRLVSNRNGKGVATNVGFAPVRLERIEHKERVTIVNTGMGIKSEDKDTIMIDEVRSSVAKPKFEGDRAVKVKTETSDDVDLAYHGQIPISPPSHQSSAVRSSPDSKRNVKESIIAAGSNAPVDLTAAESPAPAIIPPNAKIEKKPRQHSSRHDKKPVFQTDEDKEEWERHQEEMNVLRDELAGLQTQVITGVTDADGDVRMDEFAPVENKQGRLYLFQFPPVLPTLYDPLTEEKPMTKAQLEKERVGKGKGKEKEGDVIVSSANTGKPKAKANVDLTTDEAKIKVEEEVEVIGDKKHEDKKRREPVVHQEGYVGKLKIYESGRVELDWGGTKMLVDKGVGSKFLSTGVIIDNRETAVPGGGPPEGKAFSMGQIMGKFVLTPDWESIMN